MVAYFGDFPEDATVYIPFNTFTSDDPAASSTITNLADGDIKVHKDGGTTEIATDGATVAVDFDGITGNHLITIDTSVHADYATGSDYLVRIEGTTVDGATVNAWVGSFSIENRYMRGTDNAALASVVGALADAAAAGDPTSADTLMQYAKQLVNVLVGTAGIGTFPAEAAPANAVSLAEVIRAIHADVTGLNGDAMRGTDSAYTGTPPTAAAIADAVLDEALSGHTTAGSLGKAVADTESDATAILADTADMQPKLGTPAGADMSADIAAVKSQTAAIETDTQAIETDTQDIQSRLPAALNNGAIPADVQRINDVEITGDGDGNPFDVA